MTYKPGNIVLVPFPFVDSSNQKQRPALVVSSQEYGKRTGSVTLLMITSSKNGHRFGDVLLQDWEGSGLKAKSVVRGKIFSLDSQKIRKVLGTISDYDRKKVQTLKQDVFAL